MRQIGLVIGIMLVALLVSAFLSWINDLIPISENLRARFEKLEDEYNLQVEAILGLNSTAEYILALIIMAFLPAICEESLFRGGLQNFLTRLTGRYWLSIIVVSIIFSAAHFSYFGFLSRLFLGMLLGLIFHYSRNLWLCIVAHFINNAIAISVLYYYKRQGQSLNDAIEDSGSTWLGVFAVPLLIGLVYLFYKTSQRPAISNETPANGI